VKTRYKILAFVILGITFVSAGFGALYLSPGLHPDQRLPNAQDLEPETSIVDIPKLVSANNQFALKFYSQTAKNNNENIFFSPWSIFTAFSLVYEGSGGDTAQEIRAMFEFPQDDKLRRSLFQDIQNDLNVKDANYSLNTANALWIKEGYEIKEDYINTAKVYYDSQVDNVDFVTDDGVNIINEWVKTKTNNKIEELLEKDSTDEFTRLVITNVIYFNGKWLYPFSPDWTSEGDFHISPGNTVRASMMDLDARELNYTQNDLLEVLELPYKGEKISMLILLPKEIDGLESVEEILTADNLSYWMENLSETHIAVLLPKFTAETKYDLKDSLQNMGMKIPFDELNADFSGINETERLYIDQAVHKAFVNVYELGTEAAAATGIEVRATSGPPATFRADHPFIFIIQDIQTGNILFMGKVVNPIQ
jgi:serpin B